jgi:transmembrane sensor
MTPPASSEQDRFDIAASWLVRIADGPLAPADQEAFADWLAADPAHGEAFDDMTAGWQVLDAEKASSEMLALRADALDTARRVKRMRWAGGLRWRNGLALAASIAAVAVVSVLWMAGRPTLYETGLGERRVVVLADGSRLSLDADTELAVRLTDDRRRVELHRGRAKFDVAKDAGRPFTVEADGQQVIAVGTAFSVESLAGEVRVILYEGHIRVRKVGPSAAAPPVDLASGAELIVASSGRRREVRPVDTVRSLSWEGGLVTLKDEPLAVAAERFNRYSTTQISVAPSVAALSVSGVFRSTDSEAFIEGVSAIHPLSIRRLGPNQIELDLRDSSTAK